MPLPQFEADLEEAQRADREAHARMAAPETVVVRFGKMYLVGEYPYDGDVKPGCGSKLLVRTHRGLEIGELLTSTCPNAGCSKSVTRKQMLEYIENSGGSDYPFHTEGRALRVATVDEMQKQTAIDEREPDIRRRAQRVIDETRLPMKIVQCEEILGGERLTLYFTSEERVDFRDLLDLLRAEFHTRIELRHVGARDEARLIADYERCGQHCCCKQFLKVLKPVSMRSAKQQKSTLDPLKISGRCGRLMCCLRYEDESYRELDKRLPKLGKRVGTPHGLGQVVDRQILTQLVLVRLEEDNKRVAVPVEEVVKPEDIAQVLGKHADPLRGMSPDKAKERTARKGRTRSKDEQQDTYRRRAEEEQRPEAQAPQQPSDIAGTEPRKKKRKKKKRRTAAPSDDGTTPPRSAGPRPAPDDQSSPAAPKRKRRRRPDPDAQNPSNTPNDNAGAEPKRRKKKKRRSAPRRPDADDRNGPGRADPPGEA
ncbi:MAG: regulatory iron-sulfur-containing complex subunit RicT [Phycisphaerales bacterium]